MTQSPKEDAYWRRTVRLTVVLLLLWFLVTFAVSFFARELNEITVFGFPLGFYMGGQGVLVIYVAIVGFFAWRMNAIDAGYAARRSNDDE